MRSSGSRGTVFAPSREYNVALTPLSTATSETPVPMNEQQKPWRPLTVDEISDTFAGAPFPWWIAGGHAIALALGQAVRPHADIDVLILRRDYRRTREFLATWDCWVADPPGVLRPWPVGQPLDSAVHDIWCRLDPNDDWKFQMMLDESVNGMWMSRRNHAITASINDMTWKTRTGIRFLAPHIQLFYKAKTIREKDQRDFDAVLDAGVAMDGAWLRNAISLTYGAQHPWLARIPR